jgi:hypothetical protein
MQPLGVGPAELVTMLVFALSLGGAGGLPLSTPPLPPDPVIARVAPEACLFHLETAGLAEPDAGSKNLTERMLADPEMREFLGKVAGQVTAVFRQTVPAPQEANEATVRLLETALVRPLALTVERFQSPSEDGPPQLVASLVIRIGGETAAVEKSLATMTGLLFAGAPEEFAPRKIEDEEAAWQQVQSPFGPISWGTNDGSLVVAVGPKALESLLGRLADAGRKQPAWKTNLVKRLPVDRRSTLTYFHAGEALRIATSLPAPDRDKLLTVLDASGLGKLETVGSVSGMTPEGIAASTWLGFDGPPTGLFAPPAGGIGPRQLARIPADATMAQAWSLDLSAMLATVLEIVEATEPRAAAEVRENLERIRAVAGFDIDTHLLKPLGPDWTVLSVPAPGAMLPSVAIVAGVRDRATFAKTHKALLGLARNAAAAGDVELTIREIPYRDHTLFCLESAAPGTPIPVTPSWCLTDDALIVTLSPQLLKTLLARDVAKGGLEGVAEVKQALGGREPALVGVVDPVWLLGSLCGLYELAVPMSRGVLREQGVEIDLPQLPRSSAIMPFARPQVTTIRHETDGILIESTGTIPLGPLTAGGVAGISPASTPVLVGLLLPAVQSAREAARRTQMQNNFRQVMLAMMVHESARLKFPAQAICDEDGKPLLSWRVAILPYLEEGGLFKEFRLDEPWDSEHNRKLVARMPAIYADSSAPDQAARGLTTIQVLSGAGTAFAAADKAIQAGEITDGLSRTLAIVEATPDNAVPWTKPDDLEFDPERPLAGVGNPRRPGGLFAAGFFDGHVRMLTPDVDPNVFKALATPAGGESVGLD